MTFFHNTTDSDSVVVDLNTRGEFAAAEMLEALVAENGQLRAQVQRIRDLADRVARAPLGACCADSPMPGMGEWFAEALRTELDKE